MDKLKLRNTLLMNSIQNQNKDLEESKDNVNKTASDAYLNSHKSDSDLNETRTNRGKLNQELNEQTKLALERFKDDYINELNGFVVKVTKSLDPLSDLLSAEGRELLGTKLPVSNSVKNNLVKSSIILLDQFLRENSNGAIHVIQVSTEILPGNKKDIVVKIANESEVAVEWYLLSNKTRIRKYDLVNQLLMIRAQYEEDLVKKQSELTETTYTVNSEKALVNNGYYSAFIKKVMHKRQYNADVKYLLNSLQDEIDTINQTIEKLNNRIDKFKNDENVKETLQVIHRTTIAVPYELDFNHYAEHRATVDYIDAFDKQDANEWLETM